MTEPAAWNDDVLKDPHAVADKRRRVQQMFAAIAPSYDLNNRLHSFWMDQAWRRRAVKLANLKATDRVVDVACGTGDLTKIFYDNLFWKLFGENRALTSPATAQILGIDFTFQMLPIAVHKANKGTFGGHLGGLESQLQFRKERLARLLFINGDAQLLPLDHNSSDVVSIAFGIRNVQEPGKAIAEFRRVLRPGGRLIILEFSLPTNPILRALYNFYFRQILPRTATLISGDKTGAYKYLPESVNTFIGRQQMMDMMAAAGFTKIEQFPMTFGVCVCYRGVVPGL